MIDRRALLTAGVALGALMATSKIGEAETMTTTTDTIDWNKLTDAEWRKRLTPEAYDVLRKHGTERAGTSPLNHEKRKGTFACAGCDLPLFSSDTKFESGTGWPSFYQPLPDAIGTTTDRSLLHDPHRGALQPLRRPPRPRVRRRPGADRPALLHERRGAEVRAADARPVLKLPAKSAAWRQKATLGGGPTVGPPFSFKPLKILINYYWHGDCDALFAGSSACGLSADVLRMWR